MKRWTYVLVLLFLTSMLNAQCPTYAQITTSTLPPGVFSICNTNTPSLSFQVTGDAPSAYQVVWGDGTTTNGSSMVDGEVLSHTYPPGVANYSMQIVRSGCPTQTILVAVENPTKAKIGPPSGGVTKICAPGDLSFANESIDPSSNSVYIWNFGDGTGNQQFNSTNSGASLTHTYNVGTVQCNTEVTLIAYNYCNISNPSVAQFSPIQVWDVDKTAISSAYRTYCFPDTKVQYSNVTALNCEKPGEDNVEPRKELWTIKLKNPTRDSLIGWRVWWPAPGSANPEIDWKQIGTYTVQLQDSNFCGVTSATYTIDIIAPPVPNFSVNKTEACTGEQLIFTNNSGAPANRFMWDPDGDGNFEAFNGTTETYTFNDAGTYVIDFYVDVNNASPGCQVPQQLTIVIRDAPVPGFTLNPTSACNNATVTIANTTSAAGNVSYAWDFGNGTTSAFRNPGTVIYSSPGVYEITMTATSDLGCAGSVKDTVIIYDSPNASFTGNNVCLNDLFVPVNTSTPAAGDPSVTYSWGWDDGTPATAGANPNHLYAAPGNYRVFLTATSGNGCQDTEAVNITVHDLPSATFTPTVQDGCSPVSFTYNVGTQSNVQSFNWVAQGGQTASGPSATFSFTNNSGTTQPRNIRLIFTSPDGCKDSVSHNSLIYSSVNANFDVTVENKCVSIEAKFTNRSSNNGTNFVWDFGDGSATSSARNPTHNYNNGGAFVVDYDVFLRVTSPEGCFDTITKSIPIEPDPSLDFTPDQDSGCAPMTVQFVAKPGAAQYEWNFPDGTTETDVVATRTFENQTNGPLVFNIQLNVLTADGCPGTIVKPVTVFPQPTASFTQDVTAGCSPISVNFSNLSTLGATYLWKFQNGNTSTDKAPLPQTFTNASSENARQYDVNLIVTSAGGCIDSVDVPVVVHPIAVANFAVNEEGCPPLKANFINTSSNAATHSWSFGNGVPNAAVETPQGIVYINNSFTNDTVYTATLTVTSPNNCTSTIPKNIRVHPKPKAAFSSNTQGCPPLQVDFVNESLGAQSYLWNYDFGVTNTVIDTSMIFDNQSFTTPSLRNVQMIAVNSFGCADTTSREIRIHPNVFASYVPIPDGCTPHTVRAKSSSKGALNTYWNFDDGSSVTQGDDLVRVFTNPGITDSVKLIFLTVENSNGCLDYDTARVTIFAEPKPVFEAVPSRQRFPEATISINNTTAGSWIYAWDYDDGFTPTQTNPPDHTYETWGTYVIRANVSSINNCEAEVVDTVYIDPPFAIPGFTGEQDGCSPFSVNFTDTSKYAVQHYWEFGDGAASAEKSPTHLYFSPGTYDVKLTVTGPDGTPREVEKVSAVSVYETAQAFFSYTPEVAKATLDVVDFDNRSRQADTYVWDFGDGTTSTEVNPSHFYERPGSYDIILIANNQFDCPDTFLVANGIEVLETGNIVLPTAFTPNPNGSNGGKYDPKSLDNNIFFPIQDGVVGYSMRIFNRWGELIFETNDVNTGWDGYFNGEICQQDVYVYRVVAQFEDGRRVEKVGDVTLLR